MDTDPNALDWDSLIFGSYSRDEIAYAVSDAQWQTLRTSLLGEPAQKKFRALTEYVTEAPETLTIPPILDEHMFMLRRIRVTNYVHALRRGGLIK